MNRCLNTLSVLHFYLINGHTYGEIYVHTLTENYWVRRSSMTVKSKIKIQGKEVSMRCKNKVMREIHKF